MKMMIWYPIPISLLSKLAKTIYIYCIDYPVQIIGIIKKKSILIYPHSFYSLRVKIGNQEFIDTVQNDEDNIKPNWTSIRFISPATIAANGGSTSLAVVIRLWDQESITDNTQFDIATSSSSQEIAFTFDLQTNLLSGMLPRYYTILPSFGFYFYCSSLPLNPYNI